MAKARLPIVLLAAVVLLVGCDHGTKHLAKRALEGQQARPLVGGVFDLQYVENRDSAFSLLSWVPEATRRPMLTTMQLLSGGAFLLLALRSRRTKPRLALLLIAAGAVGNGLDRLARGYVVDFLHLHHWPVFNLADIYITAGAILLILAVRGSKTSPPAWATSQ